VVIVVSAEPSVDMSADVPIVRDPQHQLVGQHGEARNAIVVVDPGGRVSAILPDEAFDEAHALCGTLYRSSAPEVRTSGAPILIVPEVIDADLRASLIRFWRDGEKLKDLVASGADAQDRSATIKQRTDVVIQDKALFDAVRGRLLARVLPELKRAFNFQAASFEALRIGCYDAASGGFFRRHRDNSTPFTAHRSFAMSLNLNTGEYEGGQIRFPEFGRWLYEAPAGGAVLFSCSLLHEALPVTAGRRMAVFTFFADAAGAQREKELIAKQMAAGRSGVLPR
jgi:predicted 2-oxoglutarate/Fe(II)-dependent dioxygenase YbiX